MKYVSGRIVRGIYIWLGLERGSGRANRNGVPRTGTPFLFARPLPRSKPNQIYIPRTILPLTYFIHLPMKMEPIVSSETSAIRTQTPRNYPKRNKLHIYIIFTLCTNLTTQIQTPGMTTVQPMHITGAAYTKLPVKNNIPVVCMHKRLTMNTILKSL